MLLKCKKIHPDAKLPQRAKKYDLGYDLFSIEDKVLQPGENYLFDLGFEAELPHSFYLDLDGSLVEEEITTGAFIWDKSKVGLQNVKTLGGVIEAGYRDTWKVILTNLSDRAIEFKKGQKLCQAVIVPVFIGDAEWADELSDSERGKAGFGSTGDF